MFVGLEDKLLDLVGLDLHLGRGGGVALLLDNDHFLVLNDSNPSRLPIRRPQPRKPSNSVIYLEIGNFEILQLIVNSSSNNLKHNIIVLDTKQYHVNSSALNVEDIPQIFKRLHRFKENFCS